MTTERSLTCPAADEGGSWDGPRRPILIENGFAKRQLCGILDAIDGLDAYFAGASKFLRVFSKIEVDSTDGVYFSTLVDLRPPWSLGSLDALRGNARTSEVSGPEKRPGAQDRTSSDPHPPARRSVRPARAS